MDLWWAQGALMGLKSCGGPRESYSEPKKPWWVYESALMDSYRCGLQSVVEGE